MLLELEDIVAATASTAPVALELLDRISPTLMLIDIGLPGMNGFELARRLRERPGHAQGDAHCADRPRQQQPGR